jgi:hypothetical protein
LRVGGEVGVSVFEVLIFGEMGFVSGGGKYGHVGVNLFSVERELLLFLDGVLMGDVVGWAARG